MKRYLWALFTTAGLIALATACMPDQLSQQELDQIAHEKGGNPGDECAPPDDCCKTPEDCSNMPHLTCWAPQCEGGRCVKKLTNHAPPGSPCERDGCQDNCICAGPSHPEGDGICVPK